MSRFALLLPRTPEAAHIARAEAAAQALADLGTTRLALGRGYALIWPPTPVLHLDGRGVIIGALYEGRSPAQSLSPAARGAIIRTSGQELAQRYWGQYVAWLDQGGGRLVRAPFGDTSVYVVRTPGLVAAVSDAELLLRLPDYYPRLSLARLAQAVLDPRTTSRATGLAGVEEVLPGEAFEVASGTVTRIWQPPPVDAPADPAPIITQALDTAIAALSAGHDRLGVLLSGGLDSTIVLSTLRRFLPPGRLVALHHHMPSLSPELDRLPESRVARPGLATLAGASDEISYARLAAAAAGVELIVHRRAIAAIDLSALVNAPLTLAPSALAFRIDADAAETRFVADLGLSALVSGRGGDQVLYASTSPLTAADVVRARRWSLWWPEVRRAAARSGLPLPMVAWTSLRFGIGRHQTRRARLGAETSFLSPQWRTGAAAEPWNDLLDTLPPARAQQLGDLLDLAAYGENPRVAVINPLLAQPVIEACLALPTYVLAEGGVSRGLARRAFANRLPAGVATRLHKAGGTGFMHRLVAAKRTEIRALLLEGVLAGAGLLDTTRLETRLVDMTPLSEIEPIRLLDLVAVEVWARQWVARGTRLA